MPGNQGVGIRIYTDGAEAVRRTFKQIGDDGQDMLTRLASGAGAAAGTAAGTGLKAINAVAGEASDAIQDLVQRTGPAGRVLGALGPVGIATAAALGGLVVALGQAKEAMNFADDIQDTADKLKVTTDQLQEFRFAVESTGGTAADADAALQRFTETLGKAQSGTDRKINVFEALGFTKEEIARVKDAAAFMPTVMDRISEIGSEAQQMAAANDVGLGSVLTLARQGGDAYQDLAAKAKELGVVMDAELVKRGSEAQDQFETLSKVIDIQLKSSFIELAPVILQITQVVIDLLNALERVGGAMDGVNQRTGNSPMIRALNSLYGFERDQTAVLDSMSGDAGHIAYAAPNTTPAGTRTYNPRAGAEADKAAREAAAAARRAAAEAARRQREAEAAARKAEREARQREQRAARAQGEVYRAEDRLTGATFGLTAYDPNSVASAEFEEIKRNAGRLAKELAKQVALYAKTNGQEGLTQDEADAISYANQSADEAQRELAERQRVRGVLELTLRHERDQAEAVAAMLGFQLENANTQRERRAVALQQLAVEREQLRREQQRLDELDLTLTPAQRAARLGNFDAETGRLQSRINRGTMAPGEAFADELNRAAASGNEAFEAVYVDGLRSLEDGIFDVITGAREMQNVFQDVARSIINDLTRIGIQRQITTPLANMLFGPGDGVGAAASSAGNWMKTAGSFLLRMLPGFDVGGYTGDSIGLVHPREYVVNPAATAQNRELLEAMNAGWSPRIGGGSARIEQRVEQHFHLAGAVSPRDVVGMIRRGQMESVQASTQVVDQAAPGRQRQRYLLEE